MLTATFVVNASCGYRARRGKTPYTIHLGDQSLTMIIRLIGSLSVSDEGDELTFRDSFGLGQIKMLSPEDAAQSIWQNFCSPLSIDRSSR